ncbi:MAG: HemK family protein methyltransferase, partial [Gemmatimonadaceae bacterium]
AEHRAAGMPFAYAVGRAAFRYLTLIVDRRVLIPRQETEYLVDLVLAATAARGVVADIGTGSGCIALALASEGRYESVIASDISSDCAAVAQLNARALADAPGDLRPCTNGLRPCTVDIRVGYLLDTVTPRDRVSAIVCNPPYIAEDEIADLPSSVRDWEPRQALCSAAQGLATTFEIVHEAAALLRGGGLLALECDSRRAQRVAQHVKGHGAYSDVGLHRDLTGRDRFVLAYAR